MKIEEMIEKDQGLVYKYALSIYKPNPIYSIEDLVQIGNLGLCKNGDKYDKNRGAITTFVGTCVRNEMLKFVQKHKRKGHIDPDYIKHKDDIVIDENNIDHFVPVKTRLEKLIVLMKRDGFYHDEISKKLGISKTTITNILKRIRRRIESNV